LPAWFFLNWRKDGGQDRSAALLALPGLRKKRPMPEQELVTGTPPNHKEESTHSADNDGPTGKPGKEKEALRKEEKTFHAFGD
jgi:hypothetical protein